MKHEKDGNIEEEEFHREVERQSLSANNSCTVRTTFKQLHDSSSSMTQARYNLYNRKQGKLMCISSLSPLDINLFLHVKRSHLQMLLWTAAD